MPHSDLGGKESSMEALSKAEQESHDISSKARGLARKKRKKKLTEELKKLIKKEVRK